MLSKHTKYDKIELRLGEFKISELIYYGGDAMKVTYRCLYCRRQLTSEIYHVGSAIEFKLLRQRHRKELSNQCQCQLNRKTKKVMHKHTSPILTSIK